MGTRTMRLALCGVFLVVFLAACGGGDGGQSIPSIEYNGNPAPAMINSSNAEELALSAYEGGDFSGSTIVVMSAGAGSSSGVSVPAILSRIVSTEFAKKAAGGTVSALDTEYGNCSVNLDGSVKTVTDINYSGGLSGTMTFNNYCQTVGVNTEVVMNGRVTVSGTYTINSIDPVTGIPTNITMNQNELYHYVTMDTYDVTGGTASEPESLTIAGQMAVSINMDTDLLTLDISSTANLGMKDNASGNTFKVENYTISMSSDDWGFSVSVSISGRFYHWKHGYVDISTSTDYPILISAGAAHPYSGVIRIDASNGYAELTFVDATQYQVAGWDGTGSFDLGTLTW